MRLAQACAPVSIYFGESEVAHETITQGYLLALSYSMGAFSTTLLAGRPAPT